MVIAKDVLSNNKDIQNIISPSLIVGIDASGNLVVPSINEFGELSVTTGGGIVSSTVKEYVIHDYATENVLDSSFTVLTTLSSNINELDIFDSSGELIYFCVGEAGSENPLFLIPRGGVRLKINIALGTRISLKSYVGTINVGECVINFIG